MAFLKDGVCFALSFSTETYKTKRSFFRRHHQASPWLLRSTSSMVNLFRSYCFANDALYSVSTHRKRTASCAIGNRRYCTYGIPIDFKFTAIREVFTVAKFEHLISWRQFLASSIFMGCCRRLLRGVFKFCIIIGFATFKSRTSQCNERAIIPSSCFDGLTVEYWIHTKHYGVPSPFRLRRKSSGSFLVADFPALIWKHCRLCHVTKVVPIGNETLSAIHLRHHTIWLGMPSLIQRVVAFSLSAFGCWVRADRTNRATATSEAPEVNLRTPILISSRDFMNCFDWL